MKTAIFWLIKYDDRAMATMCVATRGGRIVDRSCRGRAVEADSAAVVHECTIQEDAKSSIKKSISQRKNHVFARNLDEEGSGFYEEVGSSSDDDETFPNA